MANFSLTGSSIDFMPGAEPGAGSRVCLLLAENWQLMGKNHCIHTQTKARVGIWTRQRDGTEEATPECSH